MSLRTTLGILLLFSTLSGCAAFAPIKGIPARYMPEEFKGPSRSGKRTINPSLLGQQNPATYLVDAGDVLGIYIEGILGKREEVPPVHIPQDNSHPPSLGYPIPVRDDGTISLPLIRPINVRGMSIRQIDDAVRIAYTEEKQILKQGRDRIFVSLQRPRTYQVLVIRQEQGTEVSVGNGQLNLGALKKGTGRVVNLPAYKNDVLHAIAQTNGLPGLDAENAIYIVRGRQQKRQEFPQPRKTIQQTPTIMPPVAPPAQYVPIGHQRVDEPSIPLWNPTPRTEPIDQAQIPEPGNSGEIQLVSAIAPGNNADWNQARQPAAFTGHTQPVQSSSAAQFGGWTPTPVMPIAPETDQMFAGNFPYAGTTIDSPEIVKIPVRLRDGQQPQFSEKDIILYDGDILFIESRETEIFYTGGLLGGGQHTLPRDYDLDILGAIAIAQSATAGGAGGASQGLTSTGGPSVLNQDVVTGASIATIMRPLPGGQTVTIKVNLYRAMKYKAERVMIQPGDYIFLQYTPVEAVGAFLQRHLLEGALFGVATGFFTTGGNGN